MLVSCVAISSNENPLQETEGEFFTKYLQAKNVHFVDVSWSDAVGDLKSFTIPAHKMQGVIDNKKSFDGSSIKGFTSITKSDLFLSVVTSTLSISPLKLDGFTSAHFFCNVVNGDESRYENDPRGILGEVVFEGAKMGYSFKCGAEIEFFLFREENGNLTFLDNNEYCNAETDLTIKAFKERLLYTLVHLNIEPEAFHHEVAPGQFEVVIGHTDALTLADRIQLTKHTITMLAKEKGYVAVFMPKPVAAINGSGMHIHISLQKEGQNAFFDKNKENYLSDEARSFITNILHRAPEFSLLLNFDINSSKRLVPGYEAPIFLCCGAKNRSAAIRVPEASIKAIQKTNGAPVRIELRWPDASCNPYLALAAIFKAGLEGIKNESAPTPFINKNIYHMSYQERESLAIKTLPSSFEESIDLFERSTFTRDLVGKSLHNVLIDLKRDELFSYNTLYNDPLRVTPWEIAHSTRLNVTSINHRQIAR